MSARHFGMLAVVSTMLGALAMFLVATVDVGRALWQAGVASASGGELPAAKSMHHFLTTNLIQAVDGYLLGTVLLVFSIGLYKLLFPSRRLLTCQLVTGFSLGVNGVRQGVQTDNGDRRSVVLSGPDSRARKGVELMQWMSQNRGWALLVVGAFYLSSSFAAGIAGWAVSATRPRRTASASRPRPNDMCMVMPVSGRLFGASARAARLPLTPSADFKEI
jgi:hypothetical protein